MVHPLDGDQRGLAAAHGDTEIAWHRRFQRAVGQQSVKHGRRVAVPADPVLRAVAAGDER
jgi:hypothetical protein